MRLRFYFDFISPYAYLAWSRIHALAERAGAEVEPVPVLFAGLLGHHGQKGPAEIEAKRLYTFKDIVRRARQHEIPIGPPVAHPFNPLLALRVTLAAEAPARRPLIDALFSAVWGAQEKTAGLDDPTTVAAALETAGLDAGLLERAGEPEVKASLRRHTEEAIEAGVFGVPTMRVGDELFFGFESFDLLERHLGGEDLLGGADVDAYLSIPVAASRR